MAGRLTVRGAELADVSPRFHYELREADRQEAIASVGDDVLGTLQRSVLASQGMCWAAESAGVVVFLIGCAPISLAYGEGAPWLVGTDAVAKHPGALTKITKRHIAIMLQTYSTLINHVDARNVASVRWLARLGFEIEAPQPFGLLGLPFHRFSMGG